MWVQASVVYTEFQDYTMRLYLKTRQKNKIPLIFFKIMCICLCLYMGVWIRVQLPEANNNPLELELQELWANKNSLLQQQSALPATPFFSSSSHTWTTTSPALLPFIAQRANYWLCCHFFFPSSHCPTTLGQACFCHHSTQMTQG